MKWNPNPMLQTVVVALSLFTPQLLPMALADDLGEAQAESSPQAVDSEFEKDLRLQGYFFGGPAFMSNVGSSLYEFGGGFDWLVYEGLGVGFEASLLGDASTGIGTGGLRLSYHFLPESPGIEPFVTGGMSFGSAAEYGLAGYTWATAGGGFNYWFHNGMALRVEVLGRHDVQYEDHTVGLRVGMTF